MAWLLQRRGIATLQERSVDRKGGRVHDLAFSSALLLYCRLNPFEIQV